MVISMNKKKSDGKRGNGKRHYWAVIDGKKRCSRCGRLYIDYVLKWDCGVRNGMHCHVWSKKK